MTTSASAHFTESVSDIYRILEQHRTIAIVGLSASWHRPSYFAAAYMLDKGYQIIPINPSQQTILGQKCYPDLATAAAVHTIDIVDCFRRDEELPALAKQATEIGAKVFWMQLELQNLEAANIATQSGLQVVANRCVKIEHARLFGGLNFAGVNTGIISSRRRVR